MVIFVNAVQPLTNISGKDVIFDGITKDAIPWLL